MKVNFSQKEITRINSIHDLVDIRCTFQNWGEIEEFKQNYLGICRCKLKQKGKRIKGGLTTVRIGCSADHAPKDNAIKRNSTNFARGCKFYVEAQQTMPGGMITIVKSYLIHSHTPRGLEEIERMRANELSSESISAVLKLLKENWNPEILKFNISSKQIINNLTKDGAHPELGKVQSRKLANIRYFLKKNLIEKEEENSESIIENSSSNSILQLPKEYIILSGKKRKESEIREERLEANTEINSASSSPELDGIGRRSAFTAYIPKEKRQKTGGIREFELPSPQLPLNEIEARAPTLPPFPYIPQPVCPKIVKEHNYQGMVFHIPNSQLISNNLIYRGGFSNIMPNLKLYSSYLRFDQMAMFRQLFDA